MSRTELLRTGAIEAARAFLAEHLRAEREVGPSDLTPLEADALQTLRDSLHAERRARAEVRRG